MIGAMERIITDGDDGKSVLNGSSDPTSNDGAGDIFVLTPMQIPFGVTKTGDVTISNGTSLIGPVVQGSYMLK